MGDALIHVKMAAFQEELEKEAFNPTSLGSLAAKIPVSVGRTAVQAPVSVGRAVGRTGGKLLRGGYQAAMRARYKGPEQAHELLQRVLHPLPRKGDPGGLLKGWQQMTPGGRMAAERQMRMRIVQRLRSEGRSGEQIRKMLGRDPKSTLMNDILKYERSTGKRSPKRFLLENREGGKLFGEGGVLSKVEGQGMTRKGRQARAIAEQLGRSGWTGQGKYTKYLPVGEKGITTGFAATAIPAVVGAKKAQPTGEGGALEHALGEAGSTLGFIGGGGLGLVTGLGASMGAQAVGSRIGRTLDRLRAGASLGQAWKAPSPTQAAKQISEIQKYYG